MRISRTIGESKTEFKADNSNEIKRKILSVGKNKRSDEIASLADELKDNSALVIKQVIGMIDKIIAKKDTLKGMPENVVEAREKLGRACIEVLKQHDRYKNAAEMTETWEWKLHPYNERPLPAGEEASKDIPLGSLSDSKKYSGKWTKAFWICLDGEPEYDKIAKNICLHLFGSKRLTIGGSVLEGSLATQRARSIAGSVQIKHPGPAPKPTVNLDVDFYWKSEFASEIHDLAIKKEKETYPRRLRSSDVGQILSKNFQTARERLASSFPNPVAPGSIGHTSDIGQVHSEVKKFYQSITRGSKRGTKGKEKLSTRLPKDNADLKRRLLQKQGNAKVMDLVRIGRVNYYHFKDGSTQDPSRYWTSSGLTEIKHQEAFLRQWRTMVVMAQRTANMWIGNTADISNKLGRSASYTDYADPLENDLITHIKGNKVDTRSMASHMPLIFGAKADFFGYDPHKSDREMARAAMCSALRISQAIRNQVTHFGNRKTFVKKLENTICTPAYTDKKIKNSLFKLMKDDVREKTTRLIKDLTSFGVPSFANEQQAEYLIGCDKISASASIDLPRFNRVLERLSGVKEILKSEWKSNDPRKQLPDPARFSGLQDQWASCKFQSAKLIYETRFRKWLEDLSSGEGRQKLADAFVETRAQGDLLAKKARPNSKFYPLITAQSEKLPVFTEEHTTIGRYFDDLRGIVTAEMKSNTRYTSNPKDAKRESAWIEAFKCDFLAFLFGEFMDREESRWILKLHSGSTPSEAKTKLREPSPAKVRREPWKVNFYYFLHLCPVDEVARLLHQFRQSTERRPSKDLKDLLDPEGTPAKDDATPQGLAEIMELYLAMHNAKFSGAASLHVLAPFKDLYEGDGFDRVFNADADDHLSQGMMRGLRQMLRFGNDRSFLNLINAGQVTRDEIDWCEEQKSKIATDQAERKRLHKALCHARIKSKEDDAVEMLREYKQVVERIDKFTATASRIRLNDHLRAYHFALKVLARLLDYAVIWERDRYFVFLALYLQQPGASLKELNKNDKKIFKDRKVNCKFLDHDRQKEFNRMFGDSGHRKLRNELAHLAPLSESTEPLNLTELINRTRAMMAYDRKLKNAVTRSIIDIAAEQGLELRFTMENHKLAFCRVASGKITHLKNLTFDKRVGENIRSLRPTTRRQSELFEKFVTRLFEPKVG